MDLYYQNDAGESINISKSLRDMNEKIGLCMNRVCNNSPHGTRIKVDDETWLIKDTGLTI